MSRRNRTVPHAVAVLDRLPSSGPVIVSAQPLLPAIVAPSVRSYLANEKAAETRRAYRSDMRVFASWCADRELTAVPASPETVAAFLAAQADGGLKAATINRRLAAIAYAHTIAEQPNPADRAIVRTTMRGIRRTIGAPKVKKAPATAERVRSMVAQIPDTLTGKRDRALILLGFACALRRSELVALELSDIETVDDGLLVMIRRSKTDQEGKGETIPVPAGGRMQVAQALADWIAAAAITAGPIFRPVNRHGQVQPGALSGFSVAAIVKSYAGRAGLDEAVFAGHSLRRGFLTSAANDGASIKKMQRISRHRSADMVLQYVEEAEQFRDHAGAGFL